MPSPGCCCGKCDSSCNPGTAPRFVVAVVSGSTGFDGTYTLENFAPGGAPGGVTGNYCYTYLFESGDSLFSHYTGVSLGFATSAGNKVWNLMFYGAGLGFITFGFTYNGTAGTLPTDCRSTFDGTTSTTWILFAGYGGTATLTFHY